MKHAYMILAHGEPELLQLLLERLDDPRNDIYIHLDQKWTNPPKLATKQAKLFLLTKRVDVRWADVSMLEAEYALFHAVKDSGQSYAYHHLLSGVDLPIKTQDYIHQFFLENNGKEFVGIHQYPMSFRADRALHYWHPFTRSFRGKGVVFQLKRILRYLIVQVQVLLGLRRNVSISFQKGGQWVSITSDLVDYLLKHEESVLSCYAGTFGADEYFIPTLLWNSPFRDRLYCATDECFGAMRYIGWRSDGRLTAFGAGDLSELQKTPCLFARKFDLHDRNFLEKILLLSQPTP